MENWRVWIDWNRDGDFTDSGELVYAPSGSSSTVSGNFNTQSGFSGQTRMRISMKWNGTPTSCETFSYGEVEDYTISVTAYNNDSFESISSLEVNVYPNPALDYFYVSAVGMSQAKMFVYDVSGKIVK